MKTAKKILVVLAVTAAAAALAPPLAADSSVESDSSAALEQGSSRDIDPEKVLVGAASSRAAMGFPADQALVADILDTESGRASLERYSIPMTPTETEEFERRLGVLAKIPDLEAALAREHASSFAALYLDHATAGVAVLLVHGDQAERDRLEALAREHLDTSDLEVRPAARSLEQLRADFKALQGRLVEADAPRHGIVAWELDEMTNDIVVVTPSASDVATASELLSSVDAPDYVRVEVREASQQSEVWGGDDLSTCSAGAQVYADTVFGRLYYTLTAAHCGNAQYHWAPPDHHLPFVTDALSASTAPPALMCRSTTRVIAAVVSGQRKSRSAINGIRVV